MKTVANSPDPGEVRSGSATFPSGIPTTITPNQRHGVFALSGILGLMAALPTQAGTFYDGPVTIHASGSLYAEGSWSGGRAGVNFNAAALQPGVPYVATGFDESTREAGMSNATYMLENKADALIDGELRIQSGQATLSLHAETTTSASLSSADHGGLNTHNNTLGGASVFGRLQVIFPSLTRYSIQIDTPSGEPSGRYIEATGASFFKTGFDSAEASSFTSSPAGVAGSFSESDSASGSASVSITILYGPGATHDTPVLPSGPSTNSPTATTVIGATLGSTGPQVVYRSDSTETFTEVSGGRWYDPVLAYGFVYEAIGDTLFTEVINLPPGFSGKFSIWAEGVLLGHYGEGDFLNFKDLLGHGVSSFAVLGITPVNEGEPVVAFPIQLGFDEDTASFRQHALEPIIVPALAIGRMPTGEVELKWGNSMPSVLEQSSSLDPDSWSAAPDQGAMIGESEFRLIVEPENSPLFFRLNFDSQALK